MTKRQGFTTYFLKLFVIVLIDVHVMYMYCKVFMQGVVGMFGHVLHGGSTKRTIPMGVVMS